MYGSATGCKSAYLGWDAARGGVLLECWGWAFQSLLDIGDDVQDIVQLVFSRGHVWLSSVEDGG